MGSPTGYSGSTGSIEEINQSDWRKICLSASGLPGFEAWAAISLGELGAAQIIARVGNTACVPYAICHRKFLRDHVNNVLFYTVSKDLLSREGITNIFYCLHSLDAPTSVDQFKNRMNFNFSTCFAASCFSSNAITVRKLSDLSLN